MPSDDPDHALPESRPQASPQPSSSGQSDAAAPLDLCARHLRFGWTTLLVFVTFGIALELLHAFKASAYLGVSQEVRREMFTLAHAHGVGLGLLHLGFALTVRQPQMSSTLRLKLASQLLVWGTLLVPGGFFLGGLVTYGGDPGVGVWLVPFGALAVWLAVLRVALATYGGSLPVAADARNDPKQ